jgi:hypothetical protein
VLALAAFGCGSTASDPYAQAADEVESAVAALDQAGSDDTAIDTGTDGSASAAADSDSDSDEATDEAADSDKDSDEATDEAAGGHQARDGGPGEPGDMDGDHGGPGMGGGKHGKGGRHGHGHHHGRGHDLLLFYADLTALQTCRDLRTTCLASADTSTCKADVHACVKPILDAAFDAMCTERTTMCEAADANAKQCERVAKHCGGETAAPDAG